VTDATAALLGRGMSFPPRVAPDGGLAWSEGEDNVRESIIVILRTDLGERIYLASFGAGLERLLFEPNNVATHHQISRRITEALTTWEPRITVQSVDVEVDPADPSAADVDLVYRIVATDALERLHLTVAVGG
jgi:phage baseplate assembly protein W